MTVAPALDVDHATVVREHLVDVIRTAAAQAPRSLQRAIGPSEIGHPCVRRIAYRLLDRPQPNAGTDPMPAAIGTGLHAWLEQAFTLVNPDGRHVTEQRVVLEGQLGGSCDLYDRELATVVDHKHPGPSALARYRKSGPGDQYRIQVHLYGLGYQLLGERVEHVAIAFHGRALKELHVWSEPYDRSIAEAALERLGALVQLLDVLDVENRPALLSAIPMTPHLCPWCPWYSPHSTAPEKGCPGAHDSRDPFAELIPSSSEGDQQK